MDATVGLVAGSGWAAGISLYGVVGLLGLLGRYADAPVPEPLTSPVVIAVALGLYALEFFADKVPYVDSAWDSVHTLVRPLGAAAVGYLLAGGDAAVEGIADGGMQAAGAAGAGVLALVAHAGKATARAAINASPEPATNVVVSVLEDGLAAGVVWLAVEHPIVALAAVGLLVVASVAVVVTLWRVLRRVVRRLLRRRSDVG